MAKHSLEALEPIETLPDAADPTPVSAAEPVRGAVLLALAVSVGLSFVLALFVAAAVKSKPHLLTIDVVASASAVGRMQAVLDRAGGIDAATLTLVTDRQAATEDLRDRTADGAIVISGGGTEVLTASAGSTAVSQLLTSLAPVFSGKAPSTMATDVVSAPPSDPRGVGIAAAAFPMIIAGLAFGVLAGLRFRRTAAKVILLSVGSVGTGLAFAAVLHWLGVVDGHFLAVAGSVALAVVAAGSFVSGMVALMGVLGIAVGAMLMVVVGNTLSGAATSPKYVPAPWGAVGQLLPPGAAGTLLRTSAYFPSASVGKPVAVLLGWLVIGAMALWAGHRRAGVEPAAEY